MGMIPFHKFLFIFLLNLTVTIQSFDCIVNWLLCTAWVFASDRPVCDRLIWIRYKTISPALFFRIWLKSCERMANWIALFSNWSAHHVTTPGGRWQLLSGLHFMDNALAHSYWALLDKGWGVSKVDILVWDVHRLKNHHHGNFSIS